MALILMIAIIAAVTACCIFYSEVDAERTLKPDRSKKHHFVFLALSALAVRFVCFICFEGHDSDMDCFYGWSELIFKEGFGSFYSSEAFTDYPPGYMYVLYAAGFIKNILGLGKTSAYMLLKLPAAVCDILCGYYVYKIGGERLSARMRNILCAFFLFNPAVIFNSSVWGQVDSVLTLLVIATLYDLQKGRMFRSYLLFAAAVFVKPQALFYAPVILYGTIENVFHSGFSKKKLAKNLLYALFSVSAVLLLSLPFGLENVIEQYRSTIGSYNYASVNAYNFWTAIGLNWKTPTFFVNALGYLSIILTVAASAVIFFSKRTANRYYYTAAFLCFSVFMLSVRMHDRYAFPTIALMLCACCISLCKTEFLLFVGLSFTQFVNMAHVLFCYDADTYFSNGTLFPIVFSILSVLLFVFMLIYTKRNFTNPPAAPGRLGDAKKTTRTDICIILAVSAVYSAVTFYNLGSFKAPQTFAEVTAEAPVTADLGSDCDISEISVYLGANHLSEDNTLTVTVTDDGGSTVYSSVFVGGDVFYWNSAGLNVTGRYITLLPQNRLEIGEIALKDPEGGLIVPVNNSDTGGLSGTNCETFFDEQDTVPDFNSYRNSTYFDEIYHARTAYEFIHGKDVYEWTHPPLGKIIISLGIRMFGMTPFGWRFSGTLFGILMLPILYVFLKKITRSTLFTACGTVLFAADFMHFAQTRIATIDVYVTFFIMLMYLFMYKYCELAPETPLKKMFPPLLLGGISTGLAIACKWTGVYAALGLAVLFFISFCGKYRKNPAEFKPKMLKTLLFCTLSFVLIPAVIYLLSYIPYVRCTGGGFAAIVQNQIDMLTYHGSTVVSATHTYSSPWYQWAVDYRPIWYYSGENGELSENISSFGNPAVWWTGIFALLFCIADALRNKNKISAFLVIGYLSQLIPWIPVTRITFIYHYFPCVPFIVMMTSHSAHRLYARNRNIKTAFVSLAVLAVILFALFYPSISGYPTDAEFVKKFLTWLPSWHLTN